MTVAPADGGVYLNSSFPRIHGSTASENPSSWAACCPQIANCKSNAALAYLAQGDFDRALQLWSEAALDGHIEAVAYPAVLAYRQGDVKKCKKILNRLARSELAEFRDVMKEEASGPSGWFQRWAHDAMEAID